MFEVPSRKYSFIHFSTDEHLGFSNIWNYKQGWNKYLYISTFQKTFICISPRPAGTSMFSGFDFGKSGKEPPGQNPTQMPTIR
jgi:hypothetical protein